MPFIKKPILLLIFIVITITLYLYRKYLLTILFTKLGILSWFLTMLYIIFNPHPSGIQIIKNAIPKVEYQSTQPINFYIGNDSWHQYTIDAYESEDVYFLLINDRLDDNRSFSSIYSKLPRNTTLSLTGEILYQSTLINDAPTLARGIVDHKIVWFPIRSLNCFEIHDTNFSKKDHKEVLKRINTDVIMEHYDLGCKVE